MAVHVVKSTDSLWGIAQSYGVTIAEMVRDNGLMSPNMLVPGLALYIRDQRLSTRFYQIKAGDSLWEIAKRYNTSIGNIVSANPGIDLNVLTIGQRINILSPNKLSLSSLGFALPYNPETVLTNLNELSDELTYLAVVAFSLTEEGYAYALLDDNAIVERSRQLNITPLLMIRNFRIGEFSPELIGNVLENRTYRNNLVRSLVQLTRTRGYGGVSIDFEFIPPGRRNDFVLFLIELKRGLGELTLQVNVHAKSEDLPTNRIVGGYDYQAIGNVADIVAVMTIDYGYPTGPPDPIAPIPWMEQVISYAVSLIPPQKLQIAMALYGYDKVVGTTITRAGSVQALQNQAITIGTTIEYDPVAKAPWYRYYRGMEEHIVWFEDIRSYQEKYRLIDAFQLSGTTFWQISLPAPQNWAYMRDQIRVVKGRNMNNIL